MMNEACHSQDSVAEEKSSETSQRSSKKPKDPSSEERRLYRKCRKHLEKLCKSRKYYERRNNKSLIYALHEDDSVLKLIRHVSPSFALKLQSQINIFKKKAKYRRWNIGQRITALALYLRNPTNYRLMMRLFHLPSPRSLKSLLNHFELKEGINKGIFQLLKKHTRGFLLLFATMKIKNNNNSDNSEIQDYDYQCNETTASHALVFMLAGITKRIKQPIAYYLSNGPFTAEQLAISIKEVLHECFKYGINVRGTLCKLTKNTKQALGILGASVDKPSITMDNKEIICMFDPQNLMLLFRDTFMKYDIKWTTKLKFVKVLFDGTGVAKWSHIQKCFEVKKLSEYEPCVTEKEMYPNASQRKKFRHVQYVMSTKVMMGIMSSVHDGILPHDAYVTAVIVNKMDSTLMAFDSDSTDPDDSPLEQNMSHKSVHLEVFKDVKAFFTDLEFVDCPFKPPCVEGWIWTFNAVEYLFEIYKRKRPTKTIKIPTKRLRLEPLNNTFAALRAYCGKKRPRTPKHFINALKTHILTDVTSLPTFPYYEPDPEAYEPVIENFYLNFFHVSRKEQYSAMYTSMSKQMDDLLGTRGVFSFF